MKKIIFYSYLKCSTCRKAAKWLASKDFEFQLIDIVKEPPLVNYLNLVLEQYSDDKGWRDFDVVENLLKSCMISKKKNFKVLKKSNISKLN